MPKVFIGSTSKDLGDYRQVAIDVCLSLDFQPVAMEHWEAMSKGATAGSLSKLDDCDLYLGIFALRYGYVEEGFDKSVTELEFDHAEQRGLDRLCFVSDLNYPFPPALIDVDRSKVEGFRARVQKLVVKFFGSVDDFKAKLTQTLVKWTETKDKERKEVRPPALKAASYTSPIRYLSSSLSANW